MGFRNTDTVFASAARTTTTNSGDFSPQTDYKGVILFLSISAASGTTPTLDIKLQGKDPFGNYADVPGAAFAQKTTTGTDILTLYPGIAETANETVSDVLPSDYRVVATIGGTTPSFTFTVVAEYLL